MAVDLEFRGPDSTRFGRRPSLFFALQFSDATLRPNPRNNHVHWMDPSGCSATRLDVREEAQNPPTVLFRERAPLLGKDPCR
jgi:hypothetical protein